MSDEYVPFSESLFVAKLIAKEQDDNPDPDVTTKLWVYSWKEQQPDDFGNYHDAASGRDGSPNNCPAFEVNNKEVDLSDIDTTPVYVWMKSKGFVGGDQQFEFIAPNTGVVWVSPDSDAQEDNSNLYSGTLQAPTPDDLDFTSGDSIWIFSPDGVQLTIGDYYLATPDGTFTDNSEERPLYFASAQGGGGGTYVCQVPSGGIPAMSGDNPGSVSCEVFALEGGALKDQGFAVTVNSLLNVVIPDVNNGGSGWVTVSQDKKGDWWVPSQGFLFEYCVSG